MIYLNFHSLFIKKDSQLHFSVIGKTAFCHLFQEAEIMRHIFVLLSKISKKRPFNLYKISPQNSKYLTNVYQLYQHLLELCNWIIDLRVPYCYTNISMSMSMSKQRPELWWMKTKGKRETGWAFARMTPANKIVNMDRQTNMAPANTIQDSDKQKRPTNLSTQSSINI